MLFRSNNEEIWWDEYYKTANPKNQSPFRFMVYNDSLYTAFWLMVISVLFFMFWGMKRTQRAVPVINPPANSTLEFVEVVGNVYFSAKNHKIIATEKIMFFLEYLRSNFQVKFYDLFPYDLTTLLFDATITDADPFTAEVKFKYTYYEITDNLGNKLYEYK